MKIVTNVQAISYGGIAVFIENFIKYLDSTTLDIQVIGVQIHKSDEPLVISNTKSFKLVSQKIDFPQLESTIQQYETVEQISNTYAEMIETYKRVLIEESPDLVYINGTYLQPWCLMQAAKSLSLPVVVHYHGILTEEFKAGNEDKIPSGYLLMEKSFSDSSFKYVFPSNLTRDVVDTTLFPLSNNRTLVLGNPVDPIFRNVQKKGDPAKVVGYVGRWRAVKNPKYLLDLAGYCYNQNLGIEFHALTNSESALAKNPGAARFINFAPRIDHSQMSRFYEMVDVVICPSIFETFGGVALESLLAGVPAIVTSRMGIAEVYAKYGLDKWVVDLDELYNFENITKLLETAMKESVTNQIRDRILEEFSAETIFNNLLKFLSS